jgi:hypothetical protein
LAVTAGIEDELHMCGGGHGFRTRCILDRVFLPFDL